jgi:hypothetical protein
MPPSGQSPSIGVGVVATIRTRPLPAAVPAGVAEWFEPQHLTPPLVVTAHVMKLAVLSDLMPLVKPDTLVGLNLFVVVPSPSCPLWLLPQHFTPPAVVNAHV